MPEESSTAHRFGRQLLVTAGIAIGLLALLYSFRTMIISRGADMIMARLAADGGPRITIGTINTIGPNGLYLSDITTVLPTDSAIKSLSCQQATVRYFLPSLLTGFDTFLATTTIDIDGLHLELDLDQDKSDTAGNVPRIPLPAILPQVRIANAFLQIQALGKRALLDDLSLSVGPPAGSMKKMQPVHLVAGQASLTAPEEEIKPVALSLDLLYSPSQIELGSLLIDNRHYIKTGHFDLAEIDQGRAAATLVVTVGNSSLSLSGRIVENTASLALSLSDLDLKDISALNPMSGRRVTGLLSAQSEITLDPARPAELTGTLSLQFQDGTINDLAVPAAHLTVAVADQQATITDFHLLAGTTVIDSAQTILPVGPLLAGDIRAMLQQGSSTFSFEITDPEGLLEALKVTLPPTVSLTNSSFSGVGELANGALLVAESSGKLGTNSFSLTNVKIPVPLLLAEEWGELPTGTSGRFAILFQDIPMILALFKERPASLPPVFPKHRLELTGNLDNNRLAITTGTFDSKSATIRLKAAAIDLPGAGSPHTDAVIKASLAVKIGDLADITSLFDLPPGTGSLQGDLSLNGPLQAPTGSLTAHGTGLNWHGLRLGDLQIEAKAGEGRLVIQQMEIHHAADFLKGTATLDLADYSFEKIDLHLSMEEAEYLAPILGEELKITGRLAASLTGSGTFAKPEASLTVQLDHGSINETKISQANLALTSSGEEFHLSEAAIDMADARIEMTGRLQRQPEHKGFTARLESWSLKRNEAALHLGQPADIGYEANGSIWAKDLLLTGSSGSIRIDGSWPAADRNGLTIRIADLNSRGWLDLLAPGLDFTQANADLEIGGTRQDPLVKAVGSASTITAGTAPQTFNGNFDFSYSRHGFNIRGFTLVAEDNREALRITGQLPFDPLADEPFLTDELALKARFELPYTAIVSLLPTVPVTSGTLHGDLALNGSWKQPGGVMTLGGRDIVFPLLSDYGATEPMNLECDLRFSKDLLTVKNAKIASPQIQVDITGEWRSPPSLAALLRGQQTRTPTGSLDLTGRLAIPDVGWMAGAMVGVHRLAGALEFDTRITGPIDAPDFIGTLSLVNGEVRTGYDIPTIRALELKAGIDKKSIRIESLQGELGGSPFSISGQVQEYLSANPQLDLVFSGSNLLLYRDAGLRLRADTSLRASGPLDKLQINGELNITDGRYTRPVDFFNFFRGTGGSAHTGSGFQGVAFIDPPLNRAQLNIKISSATGVRVKNNMIEGTLRPDMAITGIGEAPLLTGRTYIDSMRIKMPAGRINLTSGLIHMTEAEPGQVFLDLTGQSRIMGYDIAVQANGPAASPVITLSSSPPLPSDDLLLLLFTGTPPGDNSGAGEGQIKGKQVALYLGRNILSGWFNRDPDSIDETILDRLELEIGRGITRLGEDTIEAQFRLTEKVFSDDDILFITMEKDIYDAFNSGVKLVFRFQ